MKRRDLLRAGGAVVAVGAVGIGVPALLTPAQPGKLLKSAIPTPKPYQRPLVIPQTLRPTKVDGTTDYYEITQRPALLDLVPGARTAAWTYGGTFPGPTIVSRSGRKTVVRHRNELPRPVVVHLHGGHTPQESDGYPIDWISPIGGTASGDMSDMPGMGTSGNVAAGQRDYTYPLDQRAATLWYHDHRMGHTGGNVWRGLAGFHLVRDDAEDALPLPAGDRELPLMITDRSFAADGSFAYPELASGGVTKPYMNGVLGDVILVNGVPWPVHETAPARHRLRLLNASNARRYQLRLDPQPPGGNALVQIGSDGGLLDAPVAHDELQIAPGERFDVVVDFARYQPGTRVRLVNTLGSGSTAEVMCFEVTGGGGADPSGVPEKLGDGGGDLDASKAVATRTFRFNREPDGSWTINGDHYRPGRALATPRLGTTEIWRFVTDFHHPVHLHLDHFRVLSRNAGQIGAYDHGWKDTIDVRPSEAVEIVTRFTDYAGLFMLHCHNLEHEDMAMMADFHTA